VPQHQQRKLDHIRICVEEDVAFHQTTTGFESYRLLHRALPEINKSDLDTSANVLGKTLRAPLIISAITGATELSRRINRNLAAAAQSLGIGLGLGSQRPAIENPKLFNSYQVRDVAPDILLLANLGAAQLNYGFGIKECRMAVDMIGADALALHLNSLQEAIQPEGQTDFANLVEKIGEVCAALPVPVIVKEVGNGISGEVAAQLRAAGVAGIDVAGAGGTSWARVELHRHKDPRRREIAEAFGEWGIPTAESVQAVRAVSDHLFVIASGGIRNGIDAAKALALGADAFGLAGPLVEPAMASSDAVEAVLSVIIEQLRVAMFCTGSANVAALRRAQMERV